MEVKRAGISVLHQPKRGKPQTPFFHGYVLLNPCADAEVQEDVHTELTTDVDSSVRVLRGTWTEMCTEQAQGQEPGSQLTGIKTTSWYNFVVMCQWATKFIFSFRFYSQCALNLFYIIAT